MFLYEYHISSPSTIRLTKDVNLELLQEVPPSSVVVCMGLLMSCLYLMMNKTEMKDKRSETFVESLEGEEERKN